MSQEEEFKLARAQLDKYQAQLATEQTYARKLEAELMALRVKHYVMTKELAELQEDLTEERKLIRELADALYWAVRTDWDQTYGGHDEEDSLVERAGSLLGIQFPTKS